MMIDLCELINDLIEYSNSKVNLVKETPVCEWHDITDLPKESGDYLVYHRNSDSVFMCWYSKRHNIWIWHDGSNLTGGIVCWATVPTPPESYRKLTREMNENEVN